MRVRLKMRVALCGLEALVAQEVLDLVERHPFLDKPRSTRVTHGVWRVVWNEQLLSVRVFEGGTADGQPPGVASPVAAVEATSSPSFSHRGEDQLARVELVDMALQCLQTVRRERNLPAALGTLRVCLDAAPGVDLHDEQAGAAQVDPMAVQPCELAPPKTCVEADQTYGPPGKGSSSRLVCAWTSVNHCGGWAAVSGRRMLRHGLTAITSSSTAEHMVDDTRL